MSLSLYSFVYYFDFWTMGLCYSYCEWKSRKNKITWQLSKREAFADCCCVRVIVCDLLIFFKRSKKIDFFMWNPMAFKYWQEFYRKVFQTRVTLLGAMLGLPNLVCSGLILWSWVVLNKNGFILFNHNSMHYPPPTLPRFPSLILKG